MIVLKEQYGLVDTRNFTDKLDKGQEVYERLSQFASRSQKEIQAFGSRGNSPSTLLYRKCPKGKSRYCYFGPISLQNRCMMATFKRE